MQLIGEVFLGDSCGARNSLLAIRSQNFDRCDLSRFAFPSPGGAKLVRLPPSLRSVGKLLTIDGVSLV